MNIKKKAIIKQLTAPFISSLSAFGNVLHPDRNKGPLLISGSPRGGTTWLAESIAEIFDSRRLLWEPLQSGNIANSSLALSKRPYLDEDDVSPEVRSFFCDLLDAKLGNAHLYRLRNRPSNLFNALSSDKLIIKFVRGNGVVGYLRRNFDIPKPVVVIRHPCAVVASQLHMGNWQDHPHIDPGLLKLYPELERYNDFRLPLVERLAVTWVCDVLAAKRNSEDLQLVYYENIVKNGSDEIWPILQNWGLSSRPQNIDEILNKGSSTTHTWSSLGTAEGKLGRWRREMNPDNVESILAICHSLGATDYSGDLFPDDA
jgi:hypothetical protein